MKEKRKEIIRRIIVLGLLGVCAISCVKTLFQEFNVDEQYAIVLGYRIASGEKMFLELWEPHQTSGFICAIFTKIYLMLFGNTTGIVIYLRFIGILLQVAVSVFVYNVFKKSTSKMFSFYLAVTVFALQPKGIQVAEFSNLYIWSIMCTMLCLYCICINPYKYRRYAIMSAIFACVSVLCYPSYLIVIPVYVIGIYKLFAKKAHCINGYFLGTCGLIGIAYIAFFLQKISLNEFVFGISQMMTDGAHDISLVNKLLSYCKEIMVILVPIIVCFLISSVLYRMCKLNKGIIDKRNQYILLSCMTLILVIFYQLILWLNPGNGVYLHTPLSFYFIAYVIGIICLKEENKMKWIFYIPAGGAYIAAMLLTNTGIKVTGSYLLPGILAVFIVISAEKNRSSNKWDNVIKVGAVIAFMLLLLFERTGLICESEGYKADVLYVKQKALSGPAENVYCGWLDGTKYNEVASVMEQYVTKDDSVLCVSPNVIWYLLSECQISNFSTISTPTFDERLFEYWTIYPEKYPDIVIVDKAHYTINEIEKLFGLEEVLYSSEFVEIYKAE